MVRNLTLAERVVVRHAFENACEICKKVIESPDGQLSVCIHTYMHARPTAARLQIIRDDFSRILAKLVSFNPENDVNFRRDEGEACFAYVDPSIDTVIYIGDQFFTSKRRGKDTPAGTFIHETSHYSSVLSTEDNAYGDDIEGLSFTLARKNADSYEYIAEMFF
ncbi:M35 family metallo-endopeptidase [Citrobacter sp. FP75]|uniref:M35 family metallo-endopeptidase n=1 Tax=Citrobacter sp. FP75 TaxID=1852949 RepID=UPI001BCA259B|nr:M35 family metallo-endopeptidase [Citrobacter sp. FP75]